MSLSYMTHGVSGATGISPPRNIKLWVKSFSQKILIQNISIYPYLLYIDESNYTDNYQML